MFPAYRLPFAAVVTELRKRISKCLTRADDEQTHENPLADFFVNVRLDDTAKAKAKDEKDDGDDYRRPNHKTFTKCSDIHNNLCHIKTPKEP